MLFPSSSPPAPLRSDLHLPTLPNFVPFFCFDNPPNPLCTAHIHTGHLLECDCQPPGPHPLIKLSLPSPKGISYPSNLVKNVALSPFLLHSGM